MVVAVVLFDCSYQKSIEIKDRALMTVYVSVV